MKTSEVLRILRRYESRNVTFVEPDGSWPIVWQRARDASVWDAEGKRYLDLTAAFGVAACGHGNRRVVSAAQKQMEVLLHAMGDVHPHAGKAVLARELSRLTYERWTGKKLHGKTIFCNSGFEAVESALKTALLATGRKGVIAFEGGYHGLGYGAMTATHRAHFRLPFRKQLGQFVHFAPFPTAGTLQATKDLIEQTLRRQSIGAVLVEPIQGRGGIRVAEQEFLNMLSRLCRRHGALLVLDEIYTGFGRTGKWFACEHSETVPDLICLGKALTGGFPLSACVGRADLMDAAWPASNGEAIHTSTFLGHPVGCAMALAQIKELRMRNLVDRSLKLGRLLLSWLQCDVPGLRLEARGLGLMVGVEICHNDGAPATRLALAVIKRMLVDGFIILPEGEHANVIAFTPPLTIREKQLRQAVGAFFAALTEESRKFSA